VSCHRQLLHGLCLHTDTVSDCSACAAACSDGPDDPPLPQFPLFTCDLPSQSQALPLEVADPAGVHNGERQPTVLTWPWLCTQNTMASSPLLAVQPCILQVNILYVQLCKTSRVRLAYTAQVVARQAATATSTPTQSPISSCGMDIYGVLSASASSQQRINEALLRRLVHACLHNHGQQNTPSHQKQLALHPCVAPFV
jgi:hypothetical protein